MACIIQNNKDNFLRWSRVYGDLTIEQLQASGIPDFCNPSDLAPPTDLTAVGSFVSITLNWNDNTLNEIGYEVYRSTSSGFTPSASNLLTTVGQVTTYVDTTGTAGITYYYLVRAYNLDGFSAFSNEASASIIQSMYDLGVAAMTTAGYTIPSGDYATALRTFIEGLQTNGFIDPDAVSNGVLDWLYCYGSNSDSDGKRLNWADLTFAATNNNSPDFSSNKFVVFNGTNNDINLGYRGNPSNLTNYTNDSASIGFFVVDTQAANDFRVSGANASNRFGVAGEMRMAGVSGAVSRARNDMTPAFYCMDHSSVDDTLKCYDDGVEVDSDALASANLAGFSQFYYLGSLGGAVNGEASSYLLKFGGGSIRSDITTFNTLIQAYYTAINAI